jgi:hypothetical protein
MQSLVVVESVAQEPQHQVAPDATVRLQRQFHGNDNELARVKGDDEDDNLRPVMMR